MAAGTCIVVFHRWIGDNMASGVASYQKIKVVGLITAGVGLLCMTNLHSTILYGIFHLIAPGVFK